MLSKQVLPALKREARSGHQYSHQSARELDIKINPNRKQLRPE